MDINAVAPKGDVGSSQAGRVDKEGEAAKAMGAPVDGAKERAEPFASPVVNMDGATGAVILQFRDNNSGEMEFQIPSRATLQYQAAQHLTEAKDGAAETKAEQKTTAGQGVPDTKASEET